MKNNNTLDLLIDEINKTFIQKCKEEEIPLSKYQIEAINNAVGDKSFLSRYMAYHVSEISKCTDKIKNPLSNHQVDCFYNMYDLPLPSNLYNPDGTFQNRLSDLFYSLNLPESIEDKIISMHLRDHRIDNGPLINNGLKVEHIGDLIILDENTLEELLIEIQENLKKKGQEMLDNQLQYTITLNDIKTNLDNGKISVVPWCGCKECYDKIESVDESLEGFGSELEEKDEQKCVACGKLTRTRLCVSNSY